MKKEIINTILKSRNSKNSFYKIVKNFDNILNEFNPSENNISIEEYFGIGKGNFAAKKLLLENKIIKEDWLQDYTTGNGNIKNDFKGLYVFLHKNNPFYIGISKRVIGRILQHIKGKSPQTSTLAYKIGKIKYETDEKQEFIGTRKELDYKNYVEPIKTFLMKQNIAFIKIDDDDELALFEIFCSIKLDTYLNTFQTH